MYDVARLVASLKLVDGLSNPSTLEATKVHAGYRRNAKPVREAFGWVLDDFAPVKESWLSHIEPGGFILPHKDAAPWYERWQVPIIPAGYMRVDWEDIDQQAGVPFRVEHWEWHEVVNNTDHPRVHLIIDRDVIAHKGVADFELLTSPSG